MITAKDDRSFLGHVVFADDCDVTEELVQRKVHESAPQVEHAALSGGNLDGHILIVHFDLFLGLGCVVLYHLLAFLVLSDYLTFKIHKCDAALIFLLTLGLRIPVEIHGLAFLQFYRLCDLLHLLVRLTALLRVRVFLDEDLGVVLLARLLLRMRIFTFHIVLFRVKIANVISV